MPHRAGHGPSKNRPDQPLGGTIRFRAPFRTGSITRSFAVCCARRCPASTRIKSTSIRIADVGVRPDSRYRFVHIRLPRPTRSRLRQAAQAPACRPPRSPRRVKLARAGRDVKQLEYCSYTAPRSAQLGATKQVLSKPQLAVRTCENATSSDARPPPARRSLCRGILRRNEVVIDAGFCAFSAVVPVSPGAGRQL